VHNDVNEIDDDTDAITEQSDPQQTQWPDPVWSARGNMTTMPKPADLDSSLTATYDAWNRLVEVKDDGRTAGRSAWKNAGAGILHAPRREHHRRSIQKNIYDALGRRVKKHMDSAAPANPGGIDTYVHMYYTTGWQLIETRETDVEATAPDTVVPMHQFVWSARYIDSPILRDDFTAYGVMDGRIYYLTDANFNVTALVDEVELDSWQVVERYMYDPYGAVTVLDGGPGDPDNPATEPGGEGDTEWDADPNGVSDHLNPILYCGYYRDLETGLYHVRNRSYHPHLGRWVQRDPLYDGPEPMPHQQAQSLLEYAHSSPTKKVDASGLDPADGGKEKCDPKICGPDVTKELRAVINRTIKRYNAWNKAQQARACKGHTSWERDPLRGGGPAYKNAWDIDKIYFGGNAWIKNPPYSPPCAMPHKDCGDSLQVGQMCYYSGSVNYVIFGVMSKLCGRWKITMTTLIWGYKGRVPFIRKAAATNYAQSVAWAKAGYDGMAGFVPPKLSIRKKCQPKCNVKYQEGAMKVYWFPFGWK